MVCVCVCEKGMGESTGDKNVACCFYVASNYLYENYYYKGQNTAKFVFMYQDQINKRLTSAPLVVPNVKWFLDPMACSGRRQYQWLHLHGFASTS